MRVGVNKLLRCGAARGRWQYQYGTQPRLAVSPQEHPSACPARSEESFVSMMRPVWKEVAFKDRDQAASAAPAQCQSFWQCMFQRKGTFQVSHSSSCCSWLLWLWLWLCLWLVGAYLWLAAVGTYCKYERSS